MQNLLFTVVIAIPLFCIITEFYVSVHLFNPREHSSNHLPIGVEQITFFRWCPNLHATHCGLGCVGMQTSIYTHTRTKTRTENQFKYLNA